MNEIALPLGLEFGVNMFNEASPIYIYIYIYDRKIVPLKITDLESNK